MGTNPRAALAIATAIAVSALTASPSSAYTGAEEVRNVQVGPRPYYLVEEMEPSKLKTALKECSEGPFFKTDFSIGHRGAPLQFPEHTRESYEAAARMGAGILECDVTFTEDLELVCRHDQCDLHTTTNILDTGLASQCTVPPDPASPTPFAGAVCCASDITLAEFRTLCGKMDASNRNGATIDEFLKGTADWRTDVYTTCGTLLTHKESIELFKELGVKMTPELKSPRVPMPFNGLSQEGYAQKMIDEYKDAGVPPWKVYAQSFNLSDVLYWIQNEPEFGERAVYLDDRYETLPGFDPESPKTWSPTMEELKAQGVEIIAPPMWVLLKVNANGKIVPSKYAKRAKEAGLDIITWTLERSGRLIEDMKEGKAGTFYYQSTLDAIEGDGDMLVTLDVLAKKVGVLGIFSDWPGTVTYYASCMGLR
jgi:glycerophosphoryl diester phosphodiesterase